MSETLPTDPAAAPVATITPPPAEPFNIPTAFSGLGVNVRRVATGLHGGRWEAFVIVGGVEWIIATRKLGGLDDDLQEHATPGFKEARARRYAEAAGRPRTEAGPGA